MIEASAFGLVLAFGGGMLSFLSPCVLPLVPGYLAYVAGTDLAGATAHRWRSLALGACFVLGFSLVFVAMGLAATALGATLRRWSFDASIAGGILVALLGLVQMGVLRLPMLLLRDWRVRMPRPPRGAQPLVAVLIGMAFAFGWTPCIGPVLGAIFAMTATSGNAGGAALLATYAAGLGVPFLLAAMYLPLLLRRLKMFGRLGRTLQSAGGGIMVAMGVALATGNLQVLASWMLQAFPGLGTIG